MATIDRDGVYRASDGSQFRFRKGHVVADDVTYERIGDWPESGADAKAEAKPENKAAAKPENKAAK